MEEEALRQIRQLNFHWGTLVVLGLGQPHQIQPPKSNPFGVATLNKNTTFASSPNMMSASSGELFRPASFNFQPPQPPAPLQPTTVNFSGGFSSGNSGQASAVSGFGQPAHIGGAGQQALGSVLGSFGQSRQLGAVYQEAMLHLQVALAAVSEAFLLVVLEEDLLLLLQVVVVLEVWQQAGVDLLPQQLRGVDLLLQQLRGVDLLLQQLPGVGLLLQQLPGVGLLLLLLLQLEVDLHLLRQVVPCQVVDLEVLAISRVVVVGSLPLVAVQEVEDPPQNSSHR
ncbi:hypothetical protein DH2020_021867 [Rehmannia glutinosa]|uniref:Uncharacterized protein n=1 Tax=Rehmannia glutinosa TaxID=99300 RepID=A0ABR0WFH3_REHGL